MNRTKQIAAAALLMLFASVIGRASKDDQPLKVVSAIDLSRYAGLWYEVARLPNRFQEKCDGDVTAQYTLEGDRIRVVNRCRKANGEITGAKGVARLASKTGPNSRLKVRFAPSFLSFLPFVWGDYQVMELDPDYKYALIGEPGRKYLWILSRTPQMEEATYDKLTELAASQGFDVSKLVRTKQKLNPK